MRLPPEVNRVLYVRNLPFKITAEEMYDIFGKYGTIFQIRVGDKPDTRGTAFVVYDDIYDAKNAVDHLSGFNVCGRYLIVLYYQVLSPAAFACLAAACPDPPPPSLVLASPARSKDAWRRSWTRRRSARSWTRSRPSTTSQRRTRGSEGGRRARAAWRRSD